MVITTQSYPTKTSSWQIYFKNTEIGANASNLNETPSEKWAFLNSSQCF